VGAAGDRKNKKENSFMISLTVPTWEKGCIDEMVILDETKDVLKYSFSNSLDNIKTAIYARTGNNVNLKNALWKLNPELSISVKYLMNSHNVNYSMTTDIKEGRNFLVVNMRVGDNWFITGYDEINGRFFNWELIRTYKLAAKTAIDMLNNNSSSCNDTDE
jgi:hypothetical protein